MSVAEFGFYGYVMSTALVLAIAFDLGLRQSGAWLIGQEPAADRAVTTHLMTLWLVLGSLGVLACWLMLEAGGYVAGYGALALVAALNVAPMLCLRTGQGVFLGRGDLGSLNRSELISRAVMLAGTIGLWALGRARPARRDLGACSRPTSRPPLYLLWQIRGGIAPGTLFQPRLVARMLRYGAELWVAMLLLILLGRIGFWIVSWQLGEEALGLYFGAAAAGRDPGRGRDRGRHRDLQLRRAHPGHPRLRPGRDPDRPPGHGFDGAGRGRRRCCWPARCSA